MKKSLKYLPFLAALALVGCSNDDAPENNGIGGESPGYGYVAVNIMSSAGTRAEAFVDGTDAENKAKDGVFFIFDNAGQMHGNAGKAQRLTFTGSEDLTGNVDKCYNAVLVIDGEATDPTAGGTKPLRIFCVLNAPEGLENDATITSPEILMAKIADYQSNHTTAGTFIMTNSVYKDGENIIDGTVVSMVYKSATEANLHPVNIYVERIVAKIQAKVAQTTGDNPTNNFTNNNAEVSFDGMARTLKIVPTGVAFVNIADKSYLFKNVEGLGADYNWMWPAETYYRSYWEVVPVIGTEASQLNFTKKDKTYTSIVAENGENFDIATFAGRWDYVQPNTVGEGLTTTETIQNNVVKAAERQTALVMTAKLKKEDGSDLDYTLAYIRGGYTSSVKALEVVGNFLATAKGWYMRTGTEGSYEYKPFNNDALEWKNNADLTDAVPDLERYEVVAQLKDNVKVYNLNGDEVTAIDGNTSVQAGVNAYLKSEVAKGYHARVFTDGMCYYYVYVQQHTEGSGETAKVYNGVVRNHFYDLQLTSVTGVGTPVFDASDVIIPQEVENETTFYLGAKVNVLGWRVVPTQTVDF